MCAGTASVKTDVEMQIENDCKTRVSKSKIRSYWLPVDGSHCSEIGIGVEPGNNSSKSVYSFGNS